MLKKYTALHFAWAWLLENGTPAPTWNSFRCHFQSELPTGTLSTLHRSIIAIGIDWSRTKMPEDDVRPEFRGTFAKDGEITATVGDLYLKDGTKITFGAVMGSATLFNSFWQIASLTDLSNIIGDVP